MESNLVWKTDNILSGNTDDGSVANIVPYLESVKPYSNDEKSENETNPDDKDEFYVSENRFDQQPGDDDLVLKNLKLTKIADNNEDGFYVTQPFNRGEEELMNEDLILKASSAKPALLGSSAIGNLEDDGIYKSSTFAVGGTSGIALNDDEKIFDYVRFNDPKSYIKFKYKDIPKFLDLIFDRVNSDTSSNNKDALIPATIVYHMLRYAFYKKHNTILGRDFFDLFVNRVYLMIHDDGAGNLRTPDLDNLNLDNDDDEENVYTGVNTANDQKGRDLKTSKNKVLMKNIVKKKNDIVLIAYWIAVINFIYYFLLRQEGFYNSHPSFLKKLIGLFNDLSNEFLKGITNRLSDILDDSLIDYTSIPNLKEKLIFQSDWNFFKKEGATSNSNKIDKENEQSFQTILDSLYPPDLIEQCKASPMKILQILEAIIYVFKLYNINSIILKNLLSRVFSWMNNTIFDRILLNKNKKGKNYLTRSFAIQLRLNLSVIEDWIRSISKSLQDEDLELNGKSNEEFFLNNEMNGLKSIIHNFPDDLVNFQISLGNVTHFDTNSMFYSKSEYEKKLEVKRQEKEKKLKEKEAKKAKKLEAARKSKEKEEEKKVLKQAEIDKSDESKDKKEEINCISSKEILIKNEETTARDGMVTRKDEDAATKDEDVCVSESDISLHDETEDENIDGKTDIDSTSVMHISNFYYHPLFKIFKYHMQILYNLLEFLQVFTTVIDSLEKSIEKQNNKSSKTRKEIEKEVNSAVLEFLNDDFGYLNYAQVYYVCKNYKYELDETRISKKVQKFLGLLSKLSPVNTTNNKLKYTHYIVINDLKYLFLDSLFGRQVPICLPTRKELINKFGPGWRGDNKENMLKFQPYLNLQVRDMVDAIHDQIDYKTFDGEEDEAEDDDEEDDDFGESDSREFFHNRVAQNDNDDFTEISKPQDMVNSANPNGYQFEPAYYNNDELLNRENIFESNPTTFDPDVSTNIENTMSKPQNVASKAWDNNFSESKNNKDADFDFNPW